MKAIAVDLDPLQRGTPLQGLALMIGLTIVSVAGMKLWFWIFPSLPYNPAVFPVFARIEKQCLRTDPLECTVRCNAYVRFLGNCYRSENDCTADETHKILVKLGFDVPPLRLSKTT
jgi:hypothetical protein